MRRWAPPLEGDLLVRSPFGTRKHPITGEISSHTGVDLRAALGTPVYAVDSGYVAKLYDDAINGLGVLINHGALSGEKTLFWTSYIHLSEVLVQLGDYMLPGQTIGLSGATGRSTGPHLHFETSTGLKVEGRTRRNPVDMLPELPWRGV